MIRAATLDDVRRFYAEFYGGSHGEIAVVGDFDPDSVRAMLTEGLVGWESGQPYRRIGTPPGQSTPLNITLETPDKANAMLIAIRSLPIRDDHPEYPALVLADYMLGGGFLNSRLATRIRQQEGLSYGVGSFFGASAIDSTGTWTSFAIYAPENRDKVEAALREELVRAGRDGFTGDEIAKAKEGWIESRKLGRSNDAGVAGRLTQNLFLDRTFAQESELEAAVMALSPEQLRSVVERYLDPEALAYVKAGDFRPKTPEAVIP